MSKYFGPNNEEFRCHGFNPDGTVHDCGLIAIDPNFVEICDAVREDLGIPLVVTSGTRCPAHNQAVGGAPSSAHLVQADGYSKAVDILCYSDFTRARIHDAFASYGINRFEVSNKHIHADMANAYLPHPILAAVVFK